MQLALKYSSSSAIPKLDLNATDQYNCGLQTSGIQTFTSKTAIFISWLVHDWSATVA